MKPSIDEKVAKSLKETVLTQHQEMTLWCLMRPRAQVFHGEIHPSLA